MIPIQVNDYQFLVKSNLTIIEACKFIGIIIPRFCYHEKLSVAASCRMCVVELEKIPKPITACSADISSNLTIFTNTPFVKKARENILEALLLNHPLDCPICDQAGECDLQDQVKVFGSFYTRFYVDTKRGVEDKACGSLIKTIMTRCIHCTRCVRFGSEVAGVDFLGTLNRGISTEIGGYISKSFNSEISGNLIDLCPVGALTANPYFFKNRPWELRSVDTIDTLDGLGTNTYIHYKETNVVRILPRINEDLNENLISDTTRFGFDALFSINRLQKSIYNITSIDKLNFNSKKKKLFLINDGVDLELMILLQKLTFIDSTINVRSINNVNRQKNFHISWNFDKVKSFNKEVKTCFLLTSNIRVENALLNAKLRIKFFNTSFNVLGLGLPSKSNFQISFINLTFKKIIELLEGKILYYSSSIFFDNNPIFFLGESFVKRSSVSSSFFANYLKLYLPRSIIFNVNTNSNTSGIAHLGIKSLDKNTFSKTMSYVFYNLDTNYKIQKVIDCSYIFNNGKNLFLFTAFKSFYDSITTFIHNDKTNSLIAIPILNSLEFKGTYLNLEERPQQTQTLKDVSSTSSLKNSIKNFFIKTSGYISQNQILTTIHKKEYLTLIPLKNLESLEEFHFINELIRNYVLFDSIKKKFSNSLSLEFNSFTSFSKCFKYPFKSSIDDFHLSNSFLRNSLTMLECSRETRKLFDNF